MLAHPTLLVTFNHPVRANGNSKVFLQISPLASEILGVI